MKKAILFIACFAFLLVSISAFTDKTSAPAVGYKAPEFHFTSSSGNEISTGSFKGDNLLVTFWSSTDANSRIRCNRYNFLARKNENVKHLALNFDDDVDLFNEIVSLDNLSAGMQYHVEGQAARELMELYHLDRGLHSFLINPSGLIVAVDPDDAKVIDCSKF